MEAQQEIEVLSRNHKVMIFVLGTCEKLASKGLLTGGRFQLDPRGQSIFESLKQSGFRPTDHEIKVAMNVLQTAIIEV